MTMDSLTRVERNGFETSIKPSEEVSFVRVNALDADGNVIGSSNVVDTSSGDSVGSLIRS